MSPRSIGEFAGEDDKLGIGRVTQGISASQGLRGPTVKPAESATKTPLQRRKFLKVNPKCGRGDFTLSWFHRTTYRHMGALTSLRREVRMPTSAQLPNLDRPMEEMSSKTARRPSNSPQGSRVANGSKNYRRKMRGFSALPRQEVEGRRKEAPGVHLTSPKERPTEAFFRTLRTFTPSPNQAITLHPGFPRAPPLCFSTALSFRKPPGKGKNRTLKGRPLLAE